MKQATWIVLALGLMSCGGGASSPDESTGEQTTSGQEGTTSTARGAITHEEWRAMDDAARREFMAEVVVPTMRPLFAEFDAERFADVNCATCHGANAQEVGFHMPNGLAPLNPAEIPEMFQSADPMHVFMTQTVWPQMASLVGEELYNSETQAGFTCMECHATAE